MILASGPIPVVLAAAAAATATATATNTRRRDAVKNNLPLFQQKTRQRAPLLLSTTNAHQRSKNKMVRFPLEPDGRLCGGSTHQLRDPL